MLVVAVFLVFTLHAATANPSTEKCPNYKVHDRFGDHGYFFSWEDERKPELNWLEARQFCRARCMDLVSLETKPENAFISNRLGTGMQRYMWTGGRKCSGIPGCDRPDLQPASVYGWYWEGTLGRIPPSTNRVDTDWSNSGGLGKPQPDNREQETGGPSEDCLALLNNFYADGIKWHDVACTHRKPFVCEDKTQLLPVPVASNSYHHAEPSAPIYHSPSHQGHDYNVPFSSPVPDVNMPVVMSEHVGLPHWPDFSKPSAPFYPSPSYQNHGSLSMASAPPGPVEVKPMSPDCDLLEEFHEPDCRLPELLVPAVVPVFKPSYWPYFTKPRAIYAPLI